MTAIGKRVKGTVGILMLAVFVLLAARFLHGGELSSVMESLLRSPWTLVLMSLAYALSFYVKAWAWKIYAGAGQPVWKHLAPIGYSLLINHLLPVKAGDLVRTGLAAKMEGKKYDEALHTVAVMRAMDVSVLALYGVLGLALLGVAWVPGAAWLLVPASVLGAVIVLLALRTAARKGSSFALRQWELLGRLRSGKALAAWLVTAVSWVLEGFVPYGVLHVLHASVSFVEAVWAGSMTVAGQIFHVTPGGIGTYETTMSASLAALGMDGETALAVAVVSHGYKFLFSFAAGAISWLILPISWKEGSGWLSRRRLGKVGPAE
ncbi:lysylphosphatidylglycerol synthase transmembrane domain-containing protein [Cohnella candidum]|uniref:Phosphatidylglycerol lysyltransferase n=1 Tax=Cohnella candidum TaxID=2674991 RepID=A0A3G3K180_9BACL|nr:lysylphosphatidylglycerol synthase transmembrane domain-containing protein [Cohnella candidum]AYQ74213.1 UPF0104 family protein [Cohnella candidum]